MSLMVLALAYSSQCQNNISLKKDTLSEFETKGDSCYNLKVDRNIECVILNYKKAAVEYDEKSDITNLVKILCYLSTIYYSEKNHVSFSEVTQKAYELAYEHIDKTSLIFKFAAYQMNTYAFSVGDYKKSINILEEVLEISGNNIENSVLETSYVSLGNSYRFMGDNENAMLYLKKSLTVKYSKAAKRSTLLNAYKSVAKLFQEESLLDSSILYYKKGILFLNERGDQKNKVNYYLNLADVMIDNNDLEGANSFIQKAENIGQIKPYYQVQFLEIKGKYFQVLEKHELAKHQFDKAIDLAIEYNQRNTPVFKARRFLVLSEISRALTNDSKALEYIQDGLISISKGFNPEDLYENPPITNLVNKAEAMKLLALKADILNKSETEQNIQFAHDTYLYSSKLNREIRNAIISENSKSQNSKNLYSIVNKGIETAYILYDQTKETNYIEQGFFLAEKNKANILFDNLNDKLARKTSNIPDSLLRLEHELNVKLNNLKKEEFENISSDRIDQKLNSEIADIKIRLEKLISHFERNFKSYYDIKYQNNHIELNSVHSRLSEAELLLEYFVGVDSTYLIAISQDEKFFYNLGSSDSISQNLSILRSGLNDVPESLDPNYEYNKFARSSSKLYNLLLKPVIDDTKIASGSLRIVSDGFLNYLPFEILLEAYNPKPSYSLEDLEYTFENHLINYQYSTTFYYSEKSLGGLDYEHDYIGFAPKFKNVSSINTTTRSCNSNELYELRGSKMEVENLGNKFDGRSFVDDEATKTNFLSNFKSAKILHLSTHACVDEVSPNFNKIFFSDNFVSNLDLDNIEFNNPLIVLSACNTGNGSLLKGEGVMSLARSFINAGCQSTLMSMWHVDDLSTSKLMLYFYDFLKLGHAKDKALQLAKMEYLKLAPKSKRHPYYWSAFVMAGDESKISFSKPFPIKYGIALICVLLISSFLILKIKSKI